MIESILLSGLFAEPLFSWQKSEYIQEVILEFDKIHSDETDMDVVKAVGILELEEESLRPKFYTMKKDESVYCMALDKPPVKLTDLLFNAEELNDIRENGYIIVKTYEESSLTK